MIGVVDYRAGNGPSVLYALERIGAPARLVDADGIADVDRLILPGVGAAAATISSLEESGIVEPLRHAVVNARTPFLGICIGLQVIFDHSEEGDTPGLGWVPGKVRRFPDDVKVPQIGWNVARFTRAHALTRGLEAGGHFYFVNSYFAEPDDDATVLGTTDYAGEFCSVVATGNIAATQFHAEKSGELGLRLLDNFTTWDPEAC